MFNEAPEVPSVPRLADIPPHFVALVETQVKTIVGDHSLMADATLEFS